MLLDSFFFTIHNHHWKRCKERESVQLLNITFSGELHSELQKYKHLMVKFRGNREIFPLTEHKGGRLALSSYLLLLPTSVHSRKLPIFAFLPFLWKAAPCWLFYIHREVGKQFALLTLSLCQLAEVNSCPIW